LPRIPAMSPITIQIMIPTPVVPPLLAVLSLMV
jgi:hypothetical protein